MKLFGHSRNDRGQPVVCEGDLDIPKETITLGNVPRIITVCGHDYDACPCYFCEGYATKYIDHTSADITPAGD